MDLARKFWLAMLLQSCHAAIYHTVLIDNKQLKNYPVNGTLVSWTLDQSTATLIKRSSGTLRINGKPLELARLQHIKFAYQRINDKYYVSPENHVPKCSQIIYPTLWSGQECQLSPSCGITTTEVVQNGWFVSEIACLSLFTDQQPNSTVTNFQVSHNKHWAKAYDIIAPNSIHNTMTRYALSDMVMLHYLDDTFQVVPKIVLYSLATWTTSTTTSTPPAHSQQGKYICYHVPDRLYPVYYSRLGSPELALAASGLVLDNTQYCPELFTFVNNIAQICNVRYNGGCEMYCEKQPIFECDTTIDNYSPPGFVQRYILAAAMWIWDLFSHSIIFAYTRLIKAIIKLWRYLNIYIMVNEYFIVFLVATIVMRNIYAGIAIVVLLITVLGVTRY